ncbi:class I SAM-dependent methyltransferase [Megavirus chiliensis]|uniref:Glycosyltransferase sugar-binding n=2 Tax=Megamimivirinae TaxID=3044648 RepID=A0A2L2DMT0_MIMIV|nr:methyltransferase [Megavirus chiliensis]AEQ32808.1 class I SAM-dependent methyltransferase [Megavirus chiliensis]AVG47483.1 glycosyltransferase sugar-binding [Acanthamoeba polyphaga mimivirus]
MSNNKIYITLTTIPPRFKNLYETINSLLTQSKLCHKIIINIPYKYDRFPDEIKIPEQLLNDNNILVNRCKDYGPATKLLGLYEMSIIQPDDIIVVCDDDREYDFHFIRNLVDGLASKPKHTITNAGWEIETLSEYTYDKIDLPRGKEYINSGYIDILGGCCGFALLYKYINKEMININKDVLSYYVDDVWISGHLTISGIKIWMLGNSSDAQRTNNDLINALSNDNQHRKVCNNYTIKYFIDKYGIWQNKIETPTEIFTNIYNVGTWGNGSGPGSNPIYNKEYIEVLKRLFDDLEIKSIVDIGCGDWQFSRFIDFGNINYLGLDIVPHLIEYNNKFFGKKNIIFKYLDAINNADLVENTDMIILKDVVQHWPTKIIIKVLNILKTKTKYILLTNCCHQQDPLQNIKLGEYRPLSYKMYPLKIFKPIFIKKYNSKEILLINCN